MSAETGAANNATAMTLAAVLAGLAITEDLIAADQNAVANLLFAAAQAISTRASLLPQGSDAQLHTASRQQQQREREAQAPPSSASF